jgi:pimeloyl-ACP methyl ester carboxylesterase
MGSSRYWKHVIPTLSKTHRIIAPDLRGHGASEKTHRGFHVSRLAMDLQNLLEHVAVSTHADYQHLMGSLKCIASSLGCAILWSYAELFDAKIFSHMVWVDQSPMQNLSLDGIPPDGEPDEKENPSWGIEVANRGMNCEENLKNLFHKLEYSPNDVVRGTVHTCLAYRSHPDPDPAKHPSLAKQVADAEFFLREAQRGRRMWYAELMKDHTALDWRETILHAFGEKSGNRTNVLVVASSRSGCFPAEGPMYAVELMREGGAGERVEGVVIDWGGHWCFWEDPQKFCELVEPFLERSSIGADVDTVFPPL